MSIGKVLQVSRTRIIASDIHTDERQSPSRSEPEQTIHSVGFHDTYYTVHWLSTAHTSARVLVLFVVHGDWLTTPRKRQVGSGNVACSESTLNTHIADLSCTCVPRPTGQQKDHMAARAIRGTWGGFHAGRTTQVNLGRHADASYIF